MRWSYYFGGLTVIVVAFGFWLYHQMVGPPLMPLTAALNLSRITSKGTGKGTISPNPNIAGGEIYPLQISDLNRLSRAIATAFKTVPPFNEADEGSLNRQLYLAQKLSGVATVAHLYQYNLQLSGTYLVNLKCVEIKSAGSSMLSYDEINRDLRVNLFEFDDNTARTVEVQAGAVAKAASALVAADADEVVRGMSLGIFPDVDFKIDLNEQAPELVKQIRELGSAASTLNPSPNLSIDLENSPFNALEASTELRYARAATAFGAWKLALRNGEMGSFGWTGPLEEETRQWSLFPSTLAGDRLWTAQIPITDSNVSVCLIGRLSSLSVDPSYLSLTSLASFQANLDAWYLVDQHSHKILAQSGLKD